MNKDYAKFRKQAAKNLNCTQKAIDDAVDEGAAMLLAANRNGNPFVKLFRSTPAYVAALQWYLYSKNSAVFRHML